MRTLCLSATILLSACSLLSKTDDDKLAKLDDSDASVMDAASIDGAQHDASSDAPSSMDAPMDARPDAQDDMLIAMDAPREASQDSALDAPPDLPGDMNARDMFVPPDGSLGEPDTCAAARMLTFGGSTELTVHGTFEGTHDDTRTTCHNSPLPDVIYAVDVPTGYDLEISTEGSEADTIISVSRTCSGGPMPTDYACSDDVRSDADHDHAIRWSRVWLRNITPTLTGTSRVFILLDSFDPDADYTLSLKLSVTAGDTCSGTLDITGGGVVVGRVYSAIPVGAYTGAESCDEASTGGRESLFSFNAYDGDFPAIEVVSTGFEPSIYVRSNCYSEESEIACASSDVLSTTPRSYVAQQLLSIDADGRYTLFVEGGALNDVYVLTLDP